MYILKIAGLSTLSTIASQAGRYLEVVIEPNGW
jgi:hypothetical protein